MSGSALFSMIAILTIVVGGFVFFLSIAIKREAKKNDDEV